MRVDIDDAIQALAKASARERRKNGQKSWEHM